MTAQIKEFIENEFYHFHQNPELSYQEYKTTARLKADLTKFGIKILPLDLETGVVAEIGAGDTIVAIRADIDALPVQENTDLTYKSQVKGVMHACGHDSHASIILGAALLLKQHEAELKGRVRIIFQPAEEAPGGASKIIKAGGLDGVKAIYGIHSASIFDVGTLGIVAGPTHAAVEKFKIDFTGKGTHAAHPQDGVDTLLAAANFVTAAQALISRESAPDATNVLSITHLQAGNTWNVMPETALVEGTIRTYTKENRELLKRRLEEVAAGIAEVFRAKAKLTWVVELPATDNDKKLAEFAKKIAEADGFKVKASPKSLGGEDFSLYQEVIPGDFIQIGTGASYPNHNPNFKVDPTAIYPAAVYIADLAKAYLEAQQ